MRSNDVYGTFCIDVIIPEYTTKESEEGGG